jgi:DNA-binding response OmpR family regulator
MLRVDPAVFENTRVLLVEDDFRQAADLARLMSALDCKIIGPVGQLEAALALAARKAIDGAIIDMMLAGKSATPLLMLLESRKVPAIVTTAFGRSAVPSQLRHLPCLPKPINLVRLIASMEAMFQPAGSRH